MHPKTQKVKQTNAGRRPTADSSNPDGSHHKSRQNTAPGSAIRLLMSDSEAAQGNDPSATTEQQTARHQPAPDARPLRLT